MNFAAIFDKGLPYDAFLSKYGTDEHRRRWGAIYEQVKLSADQARLLAGFTREMKVIVLAGTWCGDCVNQCPMFQHFARHNDKIRIHYFDRDDNKELGQELSICGGARVPALLFLSEDGFPCGRAGDRTISAYRDIASKQVGASCPPGIVAPEQSLLASVTQDWLNEFERIQLMLRTSARLRQLHND
jgi:thiol-disulfide isomerase/thioredoxin